MADLATLPSLLSAALAAEGFGVRRPEPLNAPCFPGEFNRCMEHIGIDRRLQGDRSAQPDRWQSVSPAVRTKDFGQVGAGRHCTAFEALCALSYVQSASSDEERLALSRTGLELMEQAGLSRGSMSFGLFGGGRILGQDFAPDHGWHEIWSKLGIEERQMSWVPGPKLFALFLGNRERCGPRCEISYVAPAGAPLEIGTFICDSHLVTTEEGGATFELLAEHAIGIALGIERLIAARTGGGVFNFEPYSGLMAELKVKARFWAEELIPDALALLDSLKTSLFIRSLTAGALTAPQSEFVERVHTRIVRKLFMLGVDDRLDWVSHGLTVLAEAYRNRYPQFLSACPLVLEDLRGVALFSAWNPAGYRPGEGGAS